MWAVLAICSMSEISIILQTKQNSSVLKVIFCVMRKECEKNVSKLVTGDDDNQILFPCNQQSSIQSTENHLGISSLSILRIWQENHRQPYYIQHRSGGI